jgi:RecB family exonuclease
VIAVSGRVDRLDARPRADGADGTELVIVDYKTGRHLLSVDDTRSSLALALYAIAASRTLHRDCRQVELHHLPSGQVLTWTHTDESLARHLRRAEEVAEECAAADERMRAPLPPDRYDEVFPPRPSSRCGWCDYQRLCPEGEQAAATRRPWDALAELLSSYRSVAFQKVVRACAVVAGASTFGLCAAAGMQVRSAPSRTAISCCSAGGQALSSSP